MKRPFLALLSVLVLGGGLVTLAQRVTASRTLYTVPELQAAMAHNPGAWRGRVVLVRGVVAGFSCSKPGCPSFLLALIPTSGRGGPPSLGTGSRPLLLALGPADPLLAFLRRVPLLAPLVPGPQAVHWATPATYRIQLLTQPSCRVTFCAPPLRPNAILLDAAPPSLSPLYPPRVVFAVNRTQ